MVSKIFIYILLVTVTLCCGQLFRGLGYSRAGGKHTRKSMLKRARQANTINNHNERHGHSPINTTYLGIVVTEEMMDEFDKGKRSEDVHLNTEKIVAKYGYPVETHHTLTEDGYNITMLRIPGNGSAVFLMHGLFVGSDCFVLAGPQTSLAYQLADEGYDVWVGNSRGNKYGRSHIKMDPTEEKFWDFSWHEVGYYDLPAMIDYILAKTGQTKLKYIGHSQGTTSFFVMASERPEYNDKISVLVAIAPTAFLARMRSSLVRPLAYFHSAYPTLFKDMGIKEVLPNGDMLKMAMQLMMGSNILSETLGTLIILSPFSNIPQLNITILPVLAGHEPSGASAKQLTHYAQIVVSRKFRRFDYGARENLNRYGSRVPPSYKLNKVSVPVALVYSDGDQLVNPEDVEELSEHLPNVVDKYKIENSEQFNHFDYLMATKDSKSEFFSRIKKVLSVY